MSDGERQDVDQDWARITEHVHRALVHEDTCDALAPALPDDRLAMLTVRTIELTRTNSGLSPAAPAQSATDAGAALFSTTPAWSRASLEQLCSLARLFRGWSAPELARYLGREDGELLPGHGGELALEFVQRLALALEWTVFDLLDAIGLAAGESGPRSGLGSSGLARDDFASLDVKMATVFRAGEFRNMIELAERARRVAVTPEHRALVCNRLSGAWDGLGYFERARREARRGLEEPALSDDLRLMLLSNLANAHYTLWEPYEAHAIATGIIEHYSRPGEDAPKTNRDRRNVAWSLYVRGNAFRRLISLAPEQGTIYSEWAHRDLTAAQRDWTSLAADFDDHEGYRGIAHTCRGGLIETEVALGRRSAYDALELITTELEPAARGDASVAGAMLESCGWWCIFACNIATRYLPEAERAAAMSDFLDTAYRIAAMLPNWALRERVFTMEYTYGRRASDVDLERERLRMVVGTMGRFSRFRSIGWELLGAR